MSKLKEYAYLRLDPCSYCGECPALTIDHIVARARGGTNAPDNLTGSCVACGGLKGEWPLLPFLLFRGWVAGPR